MSARQRAWLIGISIAVGVVMIPIGVVTLLLLITDLLGLTSEAPFLDLLNYWEPVLIGIAMTVLVAGTIVYELIWRSRHRNEGDDVE